MDLNVGGGRGWTVVSGRSSEGCLCFRPRCLVTCRYCAYQIQGRVRLTCPLHPQTRFLFDLTQCPRCKSLETYMAEFKDAAEDA